MGTQATDADVEDVFNDFWRSIVMPDGVLNLEQVKRELFDFHTAIENVPLVYCHVTRSRISKVNTHAECVIAEADDYTNDLIAEAITEAQQDNEPIPMVLHCPSCGTQHVDAPEPENGWTNPPHKSHLCHSCKTVWRPADVATNGVASIETRDERDTWPSAERAHDETLERDASVAAPVRLT